MYEEYLEKIENYINDKNDEFAIMIEGPWGCGKTFFVNNFLKKRYPNLIYVSLFGVSSCEEIDEKICVQFLNKKVKRITSNRFLLCIKNFYSFIIKFKIVNFIIKFLKIAKDLLCKAIYSITQNQLKKNLGVDIDSVSKRDFTRTVNQTLDMDKYILLLDDYERCSMNFEQINGYINNFVEHKKTKVIIVANESQINKSSYENKELKMLICLNDNINFPMNNDFDFLSNNSSDQGKINKSELNKRLAYLYSECSDYFICKEKIINKTINFNPDVSYIVQCFLEENKYKSYNYIKIDEIKRVLILNNCKNMRILKAALDNFENLYTQTYNFLNINFGSKLDIIYNIVLINTLFVTIAKKTALDISKLMKVDICEKICLDEEDIFETKSFYALPFVNNYIISAEAVSKEMMKNSIDKLLVLNESLYTNDKSLYVLDHFWSYESSEIDDALNDLKTKISKKRFSYIIYPSLIARLSSLFKIGYDEKKIEQLIQVISDDICNNGKDKIDFHYIFFDDDIKEIYNNYVNKILAKSKSQSKADFISDIDKVIDEENWGDLLFNLIRDNQKEFLYQKSFITEFNIDRLNKKLSESSNKNIICFINVLNEIYQDSNLPEYSENDLHLLIDLKEKISEFNSDDAIKKYNFSLLNDCIGKIIEKMKEI